MKVQMMWKPSSVRPGNLEEIECERFSPASGRINFFNEGQSKPFLSIAQDQLAYWIQVEETPELEISAAEAYLVEHGFIKDYYQGIGSLSRSESVAFYYALSVGDKVRLRRVNWPVAKLKASPDGDCPEILETIAYLRKSHRNTPADHPIRCVDFEKE